MSTLYPPCHQFVENNYPVIYSVFCEGVKMVESYSPKVADVGSIPTTPATGYDLFRQVGAELKARVAAKEKRRY